MFGCDCFSYNCYVLLYSFMCLVIIVCFTPRRLAPRRVAVRRPGVRPPLLKRWGDCRLPRRASTPRAKGATLDTSSPHGRVLRWLQSPKPKAWGAGVSRTSGSYDPDQILKVRPPSRTSPQGARKRKQGATPGGWVALSTRRSTPLQRHAAILGVLLLAALEPRRFVKYLIVYSC